MKTRHLYIKTKDVVNGTLWARFPVINVDRVSDIPTDYPGPMGVPITFMDRYAPGQFQLIGRRGHLRLGDGREVYQRLIIRNLKPSLPEVIDLSEWFDTMGIPLDVRSIHEAEPGDEIRTEYRNILNL